MQDSYNEKYYSENGQLKDRPALIWYAKLIKKWNSSGSVLDFGSGVGHLSKRLARPKFAYETNEFARRKIKDISPDSEIVESLCHFKDQRIKLNFVAMLHVVEHISDRELGDIFRNLGEITDNNSKIMVATPALNGLAHCYKKNNWMAFSDPTHINMKISSEWIDFFNLQGFRVIYKFSDGFYDFPYGSKFTFRNLYFSALTVLNLVSPRPILRLDYGENNVFLLKKI